MLRLQFIACCLTALICSIGVGNPDNSPPEGLGSQPTTRVAIHRPADGNRIVIAGRDGVQQLVVTLCQDNVERDMTRDAQYLVGNPDIISVDRNGFITPQADGLTTIEARLGDHTDAVEVEVRNFKDDLPINFAHDVVPLFTKHGCNGGGCHGKASGQNGFRLSLLGFEPTEDYEFLIKEGRGRRLFPAAPDRSLLLMKASARIPHGGGQRIEFDSPPYRVLRRWIQQGMPYGLASDPKVVGIHVFPNDRTMPATASQQLAVMASFSDGTYRDVTRMAQLVSNDTEMANVSAEGLLSTENQSGTVAVMAGFQGFVDVFRAKIPLGAGVDQLPPVVNFVDQFVFDQLIELGLPPSKLCDDSTFLRRSAVTIAGRTPTLDEAQTFLSDPSKDKRAKWIDSLLDGQEYAENFATKWSAVLRNKRERDDDRRATFAFRRWIRDSLYENKPYDEFVREIVTASGDISLHPPVAWYRQVRDPAALVEDTAQLFLGMRIQCARCHHHPFEKWSQKDYHGFSAFYTAIRRKPSFFANQERVVFTYGSASATNPKTGESLKPSGLDAAPMTLDPDLDPRHALADWMVSADNRFFARALVNRYWKHFFGRGLIDPEDDMRVTNPPTNPKLLDALAQDFVTHGYDLKYLVRTICNSATFQLAAEPNEFNQKDKQNFSRFNPRRLDAEILLDAIDQTTGVPTNFDGVPTGTRAIELPDNGFNSYFLTVFGRPESSSACECERSTEASLAQSLHLLNSKEILGKVSADSGRAALLAQDNRPLADRITELYLIAFSRPPTSDELGIASKHIESKQSPREGLEDVVWALINTKEFLFNH
jgi:hypothetical protein